MSGREQTFLHRHPVLTGIAVAFVMLLMIFLAAEVIIRMTAPYPPPLFGFINDPERGHFIRKSYHKSHFAPDGEPYEIQTNSLGLFDREFSGESPAVLLIGDSFTISAAPFDSKWGTLLEDRLGVRVVKAGVSAYGTEKEYLLLEKIAPVVKPSLIILGHYLNDYVDDYVGIDRYTVINGHLHELKTLDPLSGGVYRKRIGLYLKALAKHHIAVYGFLSDKIQEVTSRKLGMHPAIEEFDPTLEPFFNPEVTWTETLYENNFRNILKVRDYAESVGAALLVLIIPAKEQVYDSVWNRAYGGHRGYDRRLPTMRLARFLGEHDLPFINMLEVFEKKISDAPPSDAPPQFYYDLDIHWNKLGDRVVAEEIVRFVTSRNVLPRRGDGE